MKPTSNFLDWEGESSAGPFLVTGIAGFIGFHVARRLLCEGREVVGIDDVNAYYDPELKRARLMALRKIGHFSFVEADLAVAGTLTADTVRSAARGVVIHLAAQAGVRYSLSHPEAYVGANLAAFASLLELCRQARTRHLLFASTSSVYGANTSLPFRPGGRTDRPTSFYAATKKANEVMAHSYAHLYGLPVTGMRFFTVYGPWGRPDMAMSIFADAIRRGEPVRLFDEGRHRRDYTFIDDAVETVRRLVDRPPPAGGGGAPLRLLNVGSGRPVAMTEVVRLLETALGARAVVEREPAQPGDLQETFANIDDTVDLVGYRPATALGEGIAAFARWHLDHYPNGRGTR